MQVNVATHWSTRNIVCSTHQKLVESCRKVPANIGLPTFRKWNLGHRNRDAVCVKGLGNGEGVSPSSADKGVWGSVVGSPSGVRAEPRPKTNFGHIKHRRTPVEGKLGILWDIYICLLDRYWTLTGKIVGPQGRCNNVKTDRSFPGQ